MDSYIRCRQALRKTVFCDTRVLCKSSFYLSTITSSSAMLIRNVFMGRILSDLRMQCFSLSVPCLTAGEHTAKCSACVANMNDVDNGLIVMLTRRMHSVCHAASVADMFSDGFLLSQSLNSTQHHHRACSVVITSLF